MRSSFHIATIRGIDIGVHYSWLLVFFLIAWTLAVGLFPQQFPGLGVAAYWAMGFVASLLLFGSVLVHELAHSFMAQSMGLTVRSITLFIFGGISNIGGEPTRATDELAIAIVGPASSMVLGGLFWALWLAVGNGMGPVGGVLLYLATVNILLALFNMIPGFPLDGGRVLRAAVWWFTGSLRTATRVAVGAGHAVAFLLIFGGLLIAFSGALISGIWLILIGWFLNNAAEASGRQTEEMEMFRGVTVRRVMNPRPATVDADASLSELVHDHILQRGIRALPVVEDGRLQGMITLNEVRRIPRERWDETPVEAVMTRREDLQTVRPNDELARAVQIMAEYDINQLPVVEDGWLVGLLSRSNLIRFIQVREELGVSAPEGERRAA